LVIFVRKYNNSHGINPNWLVGATSSCNSSVGVVHLLTPHGSQNDGYIVFSNDNGGNIVFSTAPPLSEEFKSAQIMASSTGLTLISTSESQYSPLLLKI